MDKQVNYVGWLLFVRASVLLGRLIYARSYRAGTIFTKLITLSRIKSRSMLFPQRTLNCGGHLLTLDRPLIMGIINVTPDSFFAGSRQQAIDDILATAEQMLQEGAAILDIGGMSSRPGAEMISVREEMQRVIPAIRAIMQRFPDAIVSIDTVRAEVATGAVAEGAKMVNDISAGKIDTGMYEAVAQLNVPYILMHMRGTPAHMQKEIQYDDVVQEVLKFLVEEVGKLRELGVKDIIVDPGLGFGKTIDHNYQLLHQLPVFRILEVPILIGLSRKSMIHKVLNIKAEDALNGSTALHMLALQKGAQILRVHDVAAASEVVTLWERYCSANAISPSKTDI